MAGGDIGGGGSRSRQRPHRKAPGVDGHRPAGHPLVGKDPPGPGIAGVLHRQHRLFPQQPGQQTQQILDARSDHHLPGPAAHTPVLAQMVGQHRPQLGVSLAVPPLQQLGLGIEQFLLDAPPGAEGKQLPVHPAGAQVKSPLGRGGLGGIGGGLRGRGVEPLHRQHIVPRPGPAFQIALGGQQLVGGVHRVDTDSQLPRQAALARQLFPGGQLAGAHRPGQAPVELLVQGQTAALKEDTGEIHHVFPLPFAN